MMKQALVSLLVVALTGTLLFTACHNADPESGSILADTLAIAQGKTLFEQKCSGCHNFAQDGIGPNLAGVTKRNSADWIRHFVQNPQATLQSGDAHAHELLKKYTTIMPAFASLKDEELNDVVAYLHTQQQPVTSKKAIADPNAIKNPIPTPIPASDIEAGLQLITQVPHSSEEQPYTRIVKLDVIPQLGSMFVLDQRGILYKLDHDKPVRYLNMAEFKPAFINQPGLATGFGSFAFHPEFVRNGTFYTTHTEAPNTKVADFKYADSVKVTLQWVLTEWKTADPGAVPFKGTSRELLRVNMVSGIHGVQEIAFNPYAKKGTADYGLLYIGIGDGGCVENGAAFLTHHPDHIWGTIIRIDPQGHNSANEQYGIPSGNPFANQSASGTVREIYAYGFRNPNRITWTRSGQILVTNIGQANIESLNLVLKGHDYGWPMREGTFALHPSGDINVVYPLPAHDTAITYPVAQFDHDEGKAISGGFEYKGKAAPQFAGKYLFGDVPSGRLFFVNMADLKLGKQAPVKEWFVTSGGKRVKLRDLCGNDRVDLHFGTDAHGEIYILTKPDGKIYKLVNGTGTIAMN